jgi:hypothetical protein
VIYCTYSGAGEALKKTKQKIISLLNFNIYGLEPIWGGKKGLSCKAEKRAAA